MTSSTETVLFVRRIWKEGWQLYQCVELEGEFDNLAFMSKSSGDPPEKATPVTNHHRQCDSEHH